ncbi:MAG TPA: efflux transporter outer membrane subunit [Deltaproteobacteria bacterium]|jgi:NodT family efflux transporter outer membrane factor (OMF) lipoprotein|nr:efflux transporter outer membrane subunit [Deltaproteobacteria bacterium]HOI06551.1 efflux transporter outer membrane subunit [Deltaproteobacteria bacterium]
MHSDTPHRPYPGTPPRRLPALVAAAAIAALLLAGCAVGPDFTPPAAPEAQGYTAEPLPQRTVSTPTPGGEEQKIGFTRDIPGEWWELYRSRPLDELIRRALQNSPTLAAAQAALRESREYYAAGRGAYFPWVDAGASVLRQKASGAASLQPGASTSPFTLYSASVNVTYSLDLFGGMRRELESLQALVDYQAFQLEGARLSLASNIVTTAVSEASIRGQIAAIREIVRIQEEGLAVVERQFGLGAVSRADVLAQRAQLAQTKAMLPDLEKALDLTRNRLAVLTGQLPGQADLPEFTLDALALPDELPVTLPSELVRQRPDIRASEALLHSASAQVGVATANLYPDITISGSIGSQAIRSGDLFGAGSAFWSLGAGLLQPVFRGGQLTALRRAAVAAYDQSASLYRETVLRAFEDVSNVLRALDADARTLKAQAEAQAAAAESLELARKQFALGSASYLTLLNAQRQEQQARIALVEARAVRYADTAALFQALGGGWWNRAEGRPGE